MRRYILKRVLLGLLTILGVSIIVFIAARLSGDVALLLAPGDASDDTIQQIRVQYGLDKPVPLQYLIYLAGALHGDFGVSIKYSQPAMQVIAERIPATLQLAGTGFLMALCLGILFGVVSATRRGGWPDWGGKLFAMLGQSMPGFWVGIMLILVFSVSFGWLPTSGIGGINHLVMPAFALGWYSISSIMRMTRSSMLDVMDSDYVKMARTKGNPENIVVWKHALKNALIPVIGLAGFQLANLIGGAVIIENVFRWPGLGSLMIDAVFARDYVLVQACVLIVSVFVITVNFVIDMLYVVIDPRIKYE